MNTTRLFGAAIAVTAFSLIGTGCQQLPGQRSQSADPLATAGGQDRAMIATATQASYPDAEAQDSQIVAVVRGDELLLANQTDSNLRDVRVWVNGSYVRQIPSIPARAQIPLSLANFYDSQALRFTDFGAEVTRVEIEVGDTLYNTLGPVRLTDRRR